MDNFDNFYDGGDDEKNLGGEGQPQIGGQHESGGGQGGGNFNADPSNWVIFQKRPTPQPPKPKRNGLVIALSVFLVVAIIANIAVLFAFRNELAKTFADNMSNQAMLDYKNAINEVLDGSDIVNDVTNAAAEQAVDRLITETGKAVAEKCLKSVMVINCRSQYGNSTATGFLISDSGTRYVLTNEHVITYERAGIGGITQTFIYSDIRAKLHGNATEYALTVVNYDENLDLALLKFEEGAEPSVAAHPAIKFAQSNTLAYGEEIVLLGNPEGIGLAVSTGTVSIPDMTIESWGTSRFIMTDAAVNPGNSGGPMLNKHGVCMGVVESKLVASNIDNMGFAVSIDSVLDYIADLNSGVLLLNPVNYILA